MSEIQKKQQDILKAINQSFEKSGKTGFYTDTSENRKLGRVGQKYKKEPSEHPKGGSKEKLQKLTQGNPKALKFETADDVEAEVERIRDEFNLHQDIDEPGLDLYSDPAMDKFQQIYDANPLELMEILSKKKGSEESKKAVKKSPEEEHKEFLRTAQGNFGYAAKNAQDREFIEIAQDVIDKIGEDRITGFNVSARQSGKTFSFQIDGEVNVFYRSKWRGFSGGQYPAILTVEKQNSQFKDLPLGDMFRQAELDHLFSSKFSSNGKKMFSAYLKNEKWKGNKADNLTKSLKGGKAENLSCKQIAEKHGVSKEHIKAQVNMGISHEMEHTESRSTAKEIAKDHLVEDPDYYTKLSKIEKGVYEEDDELEDIKKSWNSLFKK